MNLKDSDYYFAGICQFEVLQGVISLPVFLLLFAKFLCRFNDFLYLCAVVKSKLKIIANKHVY